MIDPNLPLELDDGRPARLLEVQEDMIRVAFEGSHRRDGVVGPNADWWYEREDGSWVGDFQNNMFRLQHVVPKGPDRIAEMFS